MAHLSLGVLGPLQVRAGDVPITTFESDKARALLVYLAVEAHHPHRRDTLVGLLWPEYPEESARRNFRQMLYNLRQAIGDASADPPYLLITRQEIQFNVASDHALDVATFEAQLAAVAAHAHPRVDECETCARRLKHAAGLYRGKFLKEFFLGDSAEFEEWALLHRESLHRRALEALAQLAAYHEKRGEYDAARGYAVRQLELEPWWEEAHRQLMRVLAAGGQRSAALAQYETCRQVLNKELGVEPSAETRELYAQLSRGEALGVTRDSHPVPAWTPPALPLQLTPFVGREREMAQLGELLAGPDGRLITLTGPGGVGKTRLALQAAFTQRERFQHGAVFVPLGSVSAPEFIPRAMAEALGLVLDGPADPKRQLLNCLRPKQLLLLLDSAEHLLAEPALHTELNGLIVDLLAGAPDLKLLATSREASGVPGEWVMPVEGLPVPTGSGAEEGDSSAVALFLQRARRAQVGFTLDEDQRAAVVRICRLADGLPLAIELAATWVRMLSCQEIERELEASLDILAPAGSLQPEPHRSMRAVFDHSWQLLSAEQQGVLCALSVFRGGFTREAAQEIGGATLSLLSALQSKSLLRRSPGDRYDLHDLIRQYAAERLQQLSRLHAGAELGTMVEGLQGVEARHSAYYIEFIHRREQVLKSASQLQAVRELSADLENIRLAWQHALAAGQIAEIAKPARALWYYFEIRGGFREAQALFGWAARQLESFRAEHAAYDERFERLQAYLEAHQGWFYLRLGEMRQARQLLEPSLTKLSALGPSPELIDAVHYLWGLEWLEGNHVRARDLALQELQLAQQWDDPWEQAKALEIYGRTEYALREYAEALESLERALILSRAVGDPGLTGMCLCYLGPVQLELGLLNQATESLQESAALSRSLSDRWLLAKSLSHLGQVAQARSNHQEAIDLYHSSLALFEEMGDRAGSIDTLSRLERSLSVNLPTLAKLEAN